MQCYQYVLVVSEDGPLAQLDEIRIAQIKDTPLIMRHKRFLSRTSLDRLFAKTGFQPTKKLIVDNIEATLQLVRQGMGVSYLMDIAVENVPGVKAIPLVPSQRSYCYSSLGIRENFIPNEVQK
ncbi:LysR family transcriptional regulator substrate-binding protein [Lactobacillus delbrueckii]|uniref:LysR family transcriptional regulator substrate-binding protein n=1 Tax=Lactobacillus delbrueckii TaxID=1584 RepID=UPI0021A9393E|nr:LysR family transcriptional regulator substrate-binding protein [Lactobacillus delbrueckii]